MNAMGHVSISNMLPVTQSCAEFGSYPCFFDTVRSIWFVPVPHSNLSKDGRAFFFYAGVLLLRPCSSSTPAFRLAALYKRNAATYR